MRHVAISSVETDVEISVLRNPQKQHYLASWAVTAETLRERDRVSRSVTVGRSDERRDIGQLYSNGQPSVAIKNIQ